MMQFLSTASLMGSVYDSYKDKDGFLYMCYSSEKTFGCPALAWPDVEIWLLWSQVAHAYDQLCTYNIVVLRLLCDQLRTYVYVMWSMSW
jgi:hypothetical protein